MLLANEPQFPAGTGKQGRPDAKRFAVYRNNVHHGLLETLRAIFPSVAAIMGEEAFRSAAIAHIRAHPPKGPVLAHYGGDFPDWLARRHPSAPAFLPDLARLEAAWLETYHARDAEPLNGAFLASLDPDAAAQLCLAPHPATRMIASPHPLFDLFEAREQWPPQGGIPRGTPADGNEAVLLTRPALEIRMARLRGGLKSFVETLLEGLPLAEALEAGLATDHAFDPPSAIHFILENGVFACPGPMQQGSATSGPVCSSAEENPQ